MKAYLNTEEAAAYLGIKERKLYELVANGGVPCSKVTGKWLFPRLALDRWIEAGLTRPLGFAPVAPSPIIGGSHDPLARMGGATIELRSCPSERRVRGGIAQAGCQRSRHRCDPPAWREGRRRGCQQRRGRIDGVALGRGRHRFPAARAGSAATHRQSARLRIPEGGHSGRRSHRPAPGRRGRRAIAGSIAALGMASIPRRSPVPHASTPRATTSHSRSRRARPIAGSRRGRFAAATGPHVLAADLGALRPGDAPPHLLRTRPAGPAGLRAIGGMPEACRGSGRSGPLGCGARSDSRDDKGASEPQRSPDPVPQGDQARRTYDRALERGRGPSGGGDCHSAPRISRLNHGAQNRPCGLCPRSRGRNATGASAACNDPSARGEAASPCRPAAMRS